MEVDGWLEEQSLFRRQRAGLDAWNALDWKPRRRSRCNFQVDFNGFEFIKLSFWQVRGRKPFEGKRLSVYMKVYIVVHFMTVLFAYEAVSLFKNVSLNKFPQKK